MIQYAVVVTLVAVALFAILIWRTRVNREKLAEVSDQRDRAIEAAHGIEDENQKLLHIIEAEEEVIHEAGRKKREIRNNADPGDRARAAADIMRDLARGDNADGEDSSATDVSDAS